MSTQSPRPTKQKNSSSAMWPSVRFRHVEKYFPQGLSRGLIQSAVGADANFGNKHPNRTKATITTRETPSLHTMRPTLDTIGKTIPSAPSPSGEKRAPCPPLTALSGLFRAQHVASQTCWEWKASRSPGDLDGDGGCEESACRGNGASGGGRIGHGWGVGSWRGVLVV